MILKSKRNEIGGLKLLTITKRGSKNVLNSKKYFFLLLTNVNATILLFFLNFKDPILT